MSSPADLIDHEPFFEARRKVFPKAVNGAFRRLKWIIMAVTLTIYYVTPWLRWDRGPYAPDQAALVDIANRRFYLFQIEIWPHEFYYVAGMLIMAGIGLFLVTSAVGRAWCGYACPQTVWTDLFVHIERLIDGDRNAQFRLEKAPWGPTKTARRVAKHTAWLFIAMATGGAWIFYFADAPTLARALFSGTAPFVAYATVGVLTFTTYALGGLMREQVCIYMCPWPRIQAALTDEWALNVTYKYDRGEERTSLKKALERRALGETVGDCIDCRQCVAVCPTGIDIRDGAQMDCIQCGLCIDACDTVMTKIGRPIRLIGYDNDINIQRRRAGKSEIFKIVRPRTIVYAALIAGVGSIMLYALLTRSLLDISVLHDRNPVAIKLSDGSIRNAYTVRLLNKRGFDRTIAIDVDGVSGAIAHVVGADSITPDRPTVVLGRDQTTELRVLVTAKPAGELPKTTPLTFRITDIGLGEAAFATDNFVIP